MTMQDVSIRYRALKIVSGLSILILGFTLAFQNCAPPGKTTGGERENDPIVDASSLSKTVLIQDGDSDYSEQREINLALKEIRILKNQGPDEVCSLPDQLQAAFQTLLSSNQICAIPADSPLCLAYSAPTNFIDETGKQIGKIFPICAQSYFCDRTANQEFYDLMSQASCL